MKFKKLIVIAAATVASLSITACDTPGHYVDVATGQIQQVQLHHESELEVEHQWDVSPPTRIDIIMWPDHMQIYTKSANERCEDMGGELIYYPKTQQWICENVDY